MLVGEHGKWMARHNVPSFGVVITVLAPRQVLAEVAPEEGT